LGRSTKLLRFPTTLAVDYLEQRAAEDGKQRAYSIRLCGCPVRQIAAKRLRTRLGTTKRTAEMKNVDFGCGHDGSLKEFTGTVYEPWLGCRRTARRHIQDGRRVAQTAAQSTEIGLPACGAASRGDALIVVLTPFGRPR
jgi:hypothetical protein